MTIKKKHLIWFSIFILLVVIGFWINYRKKAWFHNPIEPKFTATTKLDRIMLTFGDNTQSRIVSWCYDSIPSSAWIELSLNNDTQRIETTYNTYRTQGGTSVYYKAVIDNLLPKTRYSYRICHLQNQSKWIQFSMPDPLNDSIEFIYIGDVQDTIGGQFGKQLQNIHLQNPNAEFYCFGGDMIERPHDQYWENFFNDIKPIAGETPIIAVAGNHEYIKGISNKLEERFIAIFPYFKKLKNNHLSTFVYKQTQFFMLDSNSDFINLPAQRAWLENELKKSLAKWKIVVLHHPIYSIKGKYTHFFLRQLLRPLLQDYGVDLVLQGHEHGYARKSTNGHAPFYIISHTSPKAYLHTTTDNMDVYQKKGSFYSVIKINKNKLHISTFDKNNVVDSFSIIKQKKCCKAQSN